MPGPFKLKSGNKPPFKQMGSSPVKHQDLHTPYASPEEFHKAQGGVHDGINYGEDEFRDYGVDKLKKDIELRKDSIDNIDQKIDSLIDARDDMEDRQYRDEERVPIDYVEEEEPVELDLKDDIYDIPADKTDVYIPPSEEEIEATRKGIAYRD